MTTAVLWQTEGAPQQRGWYAQAIRSSRVGDYKVVASFAYFGPGAMGWWPAVAFAGPFASGGEAWGWAQDHMAAFGTDRVTRTD